MIHKSYLLECQKQYSIPRSQLTKIREEALVKRETNPCIAFAAITYCQSGQKFSEYFFNKHYVQVQP